MHKFLSFTKSIYHKLPLPQNIKKGMKHVFLSVKRFQAYEKIPENSSGLQTEITVLDRKKKLLSHILPETQTGLEIGPLCFPIVTKDESRGGVFYVDYTTANELRKIYGNEPSIKTEEIVETDFIWGDKSLLELLGNRRFDYVIASHVIEHVPDMLGWLKEISEVLEDGGILSLAIPDKRFTFDYYRQLTTPGMLIEAYLTHRRRPGIQSVFDYAALTGKVDLKEAWNGNISNQNFRRSGTLENAYKLAGDCFNTDHYIDAHVNVFTPINFLELLEIAIQLGLLDFTVIDFFNTTQNTLEFFVTLKRIPRNFDRQEIRKIQIMDISKCKELLN
jgi:predicted SAM-dependent methyltransferase